jgi:antitoxin PrlF
MSKGLSVYTTQGPEVDEDPLVRAFLCFMEQDMLQRPEHILPLSEDLLHQISVLTQGVEVSDDEMLPDEISF